MVGGFSIYLSYTLMAMNDEVTLNDLAMFIQKMQRRGYGSLPFRIASFNREGVMTLHKPSGIQKMSDPASGENGVVVITSNQSLANAGLVSNGKIMVAINKTD